MLTESHVICTRFKANIRLVKRLMRIKFELKSIVARELKLSKIVNYKIVEFRIRSLDEKHSWCRHFVIRHKQLCANSFEILLWWKQKTKRRTCIPINISVVTFLIIIYQFFFSIKLCIIYMSLKKKKCKTVFINIQ